MRKGAEFEELAVKYLQELGYTILCRNYHCRQGEIDIIALEGDAVVFVEVKGARSKNFADPAERVSKEKLKRILSCIEEFLQSYPAEHYRIEVIIVRDKQIQHIREVFYPEP